MAPTTPTATNLPHVGSRTSIEVPTVFAPTPVAPDIDVIPSYLPVPGMGVIPANAYVIRATEPVLVDAGPGGSQADFPAALASVIDPGELRWLWLTHTDPDHVANIAWLLEAAPRLRVITTFLAMGKMNLISPIPMDRWHFANPGDRVDVGDRVLVALAPPSFDAPETVGFYDTRSNALMSADSFGALMTEPVPEAQEIDPDALEEGLVRWATIDAPWLRHVRRAHLDDALDELRRLDPDLILSSHLPPARAMTAELTRHLAAGADAKPWVGPDQAALEQLLAQTQPS
jgi:flavorubredoxin